VIAQGDEGLEVQANEREVTLKFKITASLPNVRADEQRIAQVLFNLMSNALRHTPSGWTIIMSAESQEDRVLISVHDTGMGISAEGLPHVFERFYRADRSRARSAGGSSLGLTNAKQIGEAHGDRSGRSVG
jgi:signal transduction histidine kinase